MSKVIFICGEICSGKDTLIESLYYADIYNQIDMGTLVREKSNTEERIFDPNLDWYLRNQVLNKVINGGLDTIHVITGIRQPSLLKMCAELFEEVEYKYLVVPRSILRERYYASRRTKDLNIEFEDSIKGDLSLGMAELQSYLLTEVECDFIKNY